MAKTMIIAVGVVAVILVAAIAISFSPNSSEFDNTQNTTENEFETLIALGSETAPVTIIEIGDYQCEMCKRWFEKTRPEIIENYVDTGKANLVFIDLPFLGNDSITAAEATYCADDQGMYWDYHVKLYQLQQHVDDGWASQVRLQAIAFDLDLNMDKFNECMNSKKHYNTVNLKKQMAVIEFGADSTPSFIIINNVSMDKIKLSGAAPYSTFKEIIDPML